MTKMEFIKNWFDSHDMSVARKVVIVYDLWQNYIIGEYDEAELYQWVDPEDEIDNPAELWFETDLNNELLDDLWKEFGETIEEAFVDKRKLIATICKVFDSSKEDESGCRCPNGEWLSIKKIVDIIEHMEDYWN